MAMQQVEYEFPDADSDTTEVSVELDEKEDNSLDIEEAVATMMSVGLRKRLSVNGKN